MSSDGSLPHSADTGALTPSLETILSLVETFPEAIMVPSMSDAYKGRIPLGIFEQSLT